MSDPPKKPGSLRDRIAAFEKGASAAPAPPGPPAPRPKPAGGVSWKPRPRSPPPANNDEGSNAAKASGMSAADAKTSIGQGVSLKERMAALQGLNAFGGSAAPLSPKSATEKPKWKPPPVVSPPLADEDGKDDPPKSAAAVQEGEHDVQGHTPVREEEHGEHQGEGEVEPDAEEEERQRRAAIAARMARLGGARVGMGPPVLGKKPDIKKAETPKAKVDEHDEKAAEPTSPAPSPLAEPVLVSPPEPASAASQQSETATTDYFEAAESVHLSPESGPTPPIRSPAMPVPAGPRRAAPPRKRAAKSPSPATANILSEGAVHESPTPLPDVPPAAAEDSAPSVVQAGSLGPHGDREPEVTGSKIEAIIESVHALDTELADETKEALTNDTPSVAAGSTETENVAETTQPKQEAAADVISATAEGHMGISSTEAEIHEEVAEPAAIGTEEHHQEAEALQSSEYQDPEEETEEEEAARRKRIAERLSKAGGVNPLSGPLHTASPPTSPPLEDSIPAVERRESLRKDSHGSVASEKPSSPPPVPMSSRPEVPHRQGSVHSVRSQASVDHPTRRVSQDERGHSVEEPEPATAAESVKTHVEDIVEEPEPHDPHEAVYQEREIAEGSYVQEEAGDDHETVYYAEPTQIEDEDVRGEEVQEDDAPPPPPRRHPSGLEPVSPLSRSSSKRLSVPPPRMPPPPPPEEEAEETSDPEPLSTREPVKRPSVPPVAPPRPPPPPPHEDEEELDEEEDERQEVPEEEPEEQREEPEEELPPPAYRELRPQGHHAHGREDVHEQHRTPEVTQPTIDHDDQPVMYSGASREGYENDTSYEEPYQQPQYEGHDQDDAEDDDLLQALVHSPTYQETRGPASEAEDARNQDEDEEPLDQYEEEAHPPPSVLPGPPPVVTSPLPPARRSSVEQPSRLAPPPPVPKSGPIVVVPSARDEREILDDSDGDPIDPGFYSLPKSPTSTIHSLPAPLSPPPPAQEQPQAREQAGAEEAEDTEQARRRTIAERMAKLGGIRFGAPPPPPPVRRPQAPPETLESEEGATPAQVAETQEVAAEEEDEFARKQRIAARIAGMGGMRFGMLPGAAPPPPRHQARPPSPPAPAEEQPKTPSVPHHAPPVAPPPPPPLESPEDDGERIEADESDAEEVTYEEAQEEVVEAPPPVPSREGRHASHTGPHRPPVPQMSRPPVPTAQPAKRMSTSSGTEASASANFSYPPPPARRPSIPTHDTQDFVMVGNEENEEEPPPPPPPPRTVSLKKAHHPPSRATPHPPPLSADLASGIPRVDFGGETDLSLSGQWSEDSINYPLPPPPPTKGEFAHPSSTRSDVQLSADELMQQWGRVGVQIHETASVLFDKSKRTLVGDGSYLGFVTAALSQVPNAAHPTPPFDSFGYLIYMQTGGAVQKRVCDVMPGDILIVREAKFKGYKGLQSYNQTAGVEEPLYAIVSDYEVKKSKLRVFQANQHVGQQTVESVSYRLEDLKTGSIKIFRVLEA